MSDSNLISVLLPVYNCEQYLENAIESILDQTHTNFELLIIDDYSNDNSAQIIDNFEKLDDRVSVIRNNKNLGITKSLNKLLSVAKGEFIARQDADDISQKERFNLQLNFLKQKNLDVVYSRSQRIDNKKIIPGFSFYFPQRVVVRYKNPFIHGTLFAKKNVINNLGGYDERFIYSQDYKLVTDLIDQGCKIKIMRDVLYSSNFTGNISTVNKVQQKYYADCVKKNIAPKKNS
jgi:glycosyltransferase involved in cell wall biosynthesis